MKQKKVDVSIRNIISYLEFRQSRGSLCSVGRERLKWWRTNARKFANVKEALLTWDDRDIERWLDYAGICQHESSLSKNKQFAFAIQNADKLPKAAQVALAALQKALEFDESPLRKAVKRLPVEKFLPAIWVPEQ